MNFSPPENDRKNWRRYIIIWAATAVITSFLTFLLLSAHSLYQVGSAHWESEHSPYDLKQEYILNTIIGGTRIELIKAGFSHDGIILAPLNWLHKQVYENAQKEIPANDGEIIIWQNAYELQPLMISTPKIETAPVVQKVFGALTFLTEHEIRSPQVRDIEKFVLMRRFIIFIESHNENALLNGEQQDALVRNSVKAVKEIDLQKFLSNSDDSVRLVPLTFAQMVHALVTKNIEANGLGSCDSENAKNIVFLQKIIAKWLPQYSDLTLHIPNYEEKLRNALVLKSKTTFPEMRALLKEKCGIEVPAAYGT